MSFGVVDPAAKIDVSQEIAIKVVRDQLKMQQYMAVAMTQPTMVYDTNGTVRAVPPQPRFDMQM